MVVETLKSLILSVSKLLLIASTDTLKEIKKLSYRICIVCGMYVVPYSFIYILHRLLSCILQYFALCLFSLYIAITDRGGSRGNNDVRHVDRGPSDVEDACQGRGQNQNNPPLLLHLALIIAHHEAAASYT